MSLMSLQEIKKLFAKEHVKEIGYINGMRYFYSKTGQEISEDVYLKFMNGDY